MFIHDHVADLPVQITVEVLGVSRSMSHAAMSRITLRRIAA
jgi:hypothetical protein